ncbi:MAG: hypothetical protein AB8F95_01025 [Bacteroidia bacterium]
MSNQEKHSEFEELYEDSSLQDALRNIEVKKATRKLWRIVWILYGVLAVVFFGLEVGFFIGLLMFCGTFLLGGASAFFLGAIPYRDYSFSERVDFLFPFVIIGMNVIMVGIVMLFFVLNQMV